MARYKVQAPDGSIRELEGPDGATDEQIAAVAAQTFGAKPDPKPQGVMDRLGRIPGDLKQGVLELFSGAAGAAAAGEGGLGGKVAQAEVPAPQARTPVDTLDRYQQAATQGIGGAAVMPMGGLARLPVNLLSGAMSGAGGELGGQLTGDIPIARLLGSILGGGAVSAGIGARNAVRGNAPCPRGEDPRWGA